MPDPFHDEMLAALPRLHRLALALTHSRTEAEDLVQEVAIAALGARHTFMPGTNFGAWVSTIMRNRFRLNRRRRREICALDEVADGLLVTCAAHDERIVLEELQQALNGLPAEQRHSLWSLQEIRRVASRSAASSPRSSSLGRLGAAPIRPTSGPHSAPAT